ncbi:antibiotic biosynthesis monooxygenase family protein [Halalkalibacter alkalisediminis]|uniref:Antibiotic biosynthesis monooxygenase family protein n=1 Tax=Halalkalibacter alkalisediminis TaxID=935616 RepID=A0ABV6NM96_9BACI|nr:antibiotic biosynthesis monooxygenase [Halalkalibacter alkalisediminis]
MKTATILKDANDTVQLEGLRLQGETGNDLYVEDSIDHPTAKHYEIFGETGSFKKEGYVVMNNIAVVENGRGTFEERFRNRAGLVETEPGFQAIRILRPLDDDTYVIMTVWDNEESFKSWQTSKSYENAHKKRGTQAALATSIFPRPSFVTTFYSKG